MGKYGLYCSCEREVSETGLSLLKGTVVTDVRLQNPDEDAPLTILTFSNGKTLKICSSDDGEYDSMKVVSNETEGPSNNWESTDYLLDAFVYKS